jgi:diaminohydroxyphosphoribosylaminopyrimidine deaminase / 5-amino-6-(5-phosphoribosylamino)uracil reductase
MMLYREMPYKNLDDVYIARCLLLAELGYATVSPNPMVGSIVLDEKGVVVGEGYHQKAGEDHAEIIALAQAGEKARGGTLYVNLEPCNHQGRTPPCTQQIIAAGIQRIVCGTLDTNPLVAGAGRDTLQNARISVRYGYLEEECRQLNRVFFHYVQNRQPFVSVKLALTMDGKIANRQGESKWLTGSLARQSVHYLRHRHDAILTTAETVLQDNPRLTVREIPNIEKQPKKIILDRQLRLNPERCELFQPDNRQGLWIVTSRYQQDNPRLGQIRAMGIEVITVNEDTGGLNLQELLTTVGEQNICSIMVEAGGNLAGSLMQAGLVNYYYLYYAPKVMQDYMAKSAFGQQFSLNFPHLPQLDIMSTQTIDQDLLIEAQPVASTTSKPGRVNSQG